MAESHVRKRIMRKVTNSLIRTDRLIHLSLFLQYLAEIQIGAGERGVAIDDLPDLEQGRIVVTRNILGPTDIRLYIQ